MRRTTVTYGQLDRVLRSLKFTCRPTRDESPGWIYEHPPTGAEIILPAYPAGDKVMEHHLADVRMQLDYNGIADPEALDAKLQKAG